jgi:hypothetical protein
MHQRRPAPHHAVSILMGLLIGFLIWEKHPGAAVIVRPIKPRATLDSFGGGGGHV